MGQWLESLVPWGWRGAVALVDGDEAVLASGFGPLAPEGRSEAIGVNTRFAIGSITKDFVDLAVLLLEDRGRLQREDTLGELLAGVPPDKAPVTVDDLMTHTAGFEHVHGGDYEQIDRPEALRRIFGQQLLFEPGTDEHYSNSGYTLLAAIIEEASGRGFDDFLRQEIFEPAGMTNTGYEGDPVPSGRDEAVGVDAEGHAVAPSDLGPVSWTLRGGGGVVSTVADLAAFNRAICDGGIAPDEVVEQLPYCGQHGAFGTAGGGSEFSHTASLEKDLDGGMTLVVLSADQPFPAEEVALRVLGHVLEGEELPAVPAVGDLAPDEIERVAGDYESDGGATITVEATPAGVRLATEDPDAFDALFALPDEIPDIAPIDEVVPLARDLLTHQADELGLDREYAELGSLRDLEPLGVAPVGEYEPMTFLRAHFERGSILTAWVFSSDGEWLEADLSADPPGVGFRPAVEGGFVSFTLRGVPIADRVTFRDDGTMVIQIEGRSVHYRRTG